MVNINEYGERLLRCRYFGWRFLYIIFSGYFIKKVTKILMFLSGVLALLICLQSQGIINVEVNVDKIQSYAEAIVNTIAINTNNIFPTDNNSSTIGNNLGIPLAKALHQGLCYPLLRVAR